MSYRDYLLRKSKFSKRYLTLLVLFIFGIIVLFGIHCLVNCPSNTNPFTQFDYPSSGNLFHILQLNDTSHIPKLFAYKPRLLSPISIDMQSHTKVAISVKSSIGNFQKRQQIRQTWASFNCRMSLEFSVLFVLGTNDRLNTAEREIQEQVATESAKYGDILQYDFHDNYYNNTYKVMSIMDYFVTNLAGVRFLLIVDDDYFVNPRILMETVSADFSEDEFHSFVGGFVWYENRPIRYKSNKWYVSYDSYPYEYYPPYATGGFILISNVMVKKFHKLLPFVQYLPFEDVLIGILLFKLKTYPTHMGNVFGSDTSFPPNLLAAHGCPGNCLQYWWRNNYHRNCR